MIYMPALCQSQESAVIITLQHYQCSEHDGVALAVALTVPFTPLLGVGLASPSVILPSNSSTLGTSIFTVQFDGMQLNCTQLLDVHGSFPTTSKRVGLAASSARASSVLGKKVKKVGVGKRTAWLRATGTEPRRWA